MSVQRQVEKCYNCEKRTICGKYETRVLNNDGLACPEHIFDDFIYGPLGPQKAPFVGSFQVGPKIKDH